VHSLVHQLHWHDWAGQVRFATLKHLHVSELWVLLTAEHLFFLLHVFLAGGGAFLSAPTSLANKRFDLADLLVSETPFLSIFSGDSTG
jgi:hypothetical protein